MVFVRQIILKSLASRGARKRGLMGAQQLAEQLRPEGGSLRRTWWIISLYAALALLLIPVFPHLPSANEFSRWALTASIVERGSFEVSPEIALLGDRIIDLAMVDGRVYSNKAPGGSLAAVPAYLLSRTLVGPPAPGNLRQTVTAMRLGICTIPLLALCLWFALHARRAGIAPQRIAFAIAVMLFGTPLFAYGLLLFSHAMTAVALLGAWLMLFGDSRLREPTRELAAGLLIGLAAISEYPTAIPGAVLVACALRRRGIVGGLRIAAGALPMLVALGLYNHAAFGSVFALSSSFERSTTFRELSRSGWWGVALPSPITAARLLFDPAKGLLVFSPVLLLAFAAIPAARRSLAPAAFWALTLAPLSLILVYAGYPNWHGGWTVGARYLVPVVPFLAYLLLLGRPRTIDAFLLGASAAAIAITTLVFPFVSEGYAFPWASFAAPLLAKGLVAPNLLHFVSRGAAVAVPFALVAVAIFLAAESRRSPHTIAGIVVWTLAGFLCVATWFPDGDGSRWYVENVYFERLDVLRRAQPQFDPMFLRRMQVDYSLPPSSWPF
jgi:lipid-A-disaccharide synthase-like uncharacterized protein